MQLLYTFIIQYIFRNYCKTAIIVIILKQMIFKIFMILIFYDIK